MAKNPRNDRVSMGYRPLASIISNEVRCACGALLCKVVTGDTNGIEIKCQRCKRLDFIPCEIEVHQMAKQGQDEGLEERCECRNLLGKFVGNNLEIKCRRCKNMVILPFRFSNNYLARKRY